MKVETIDIKKVTPYARNPRNNSISVAKVAASIKEFGWQQPIVVDSEMTIVAGHTRYEAALQLGMKKVPIQIANDLTPAQVKAYRIADNRLHEDASWDHELLTIEIGELKEEGFDLGITGFDEGELEKMLEDNNPSSVDGSKELDEDDFQEFQHTCPKCGFQFSDGDIHDGDS